MKPTDVASPASHSPRPPSGTPLNSPSQHPSSQAGAIDRLGQVLEPFVRALEKLDPATEAEGAHPKGTEDVKAVEPRARASKLEYKVLEEVWESAASKYKVVESTVPEEVTELDEYVFLDRARVEKDTFEEIHYLDINSDGLRDVLRMVLRDAHGFSVLEDKITVERNLLFHYVAELEACRTELKSKGDNDAKVQHLSLLVDYIKTTYTSTKTRLAIYLKNREITYDLLWALFKPHSAVYTTILDSAKPACFRYDSGKEKTGSDGVTYFHVECRYMDYNGTAFGEVSTALGIRKFPGKKSIDSLEAFPLVFHRRHQEMKKYLLRCGQKFLSLMGIHHAQYSGNAFFFEMGDYTQVPVESRIMVDVAYFRKVNPNYVRPRINELAQSTRSYFDMVPDAVKSKGLEPKTLSDADLMICSQAVYVEFVVDDIEAIVWNPSSFHNLEIPRAKKSVITALAKAHMARGPDYTFDDFVEGKGQGLIALLHGPPGVGKTLTAEALSEYLERPLYVVSAGELGQDATKLEDRLSRVSQVAHHWKAFVLLDEADVFVQARSFNNQHNALVSVFLRKLEYFRGILFLTTNRVKDIDDAIQSRVSVALHYGPLGLDTRKTIWASFLKKGAAKYTPQDLDWLAQREVNGRQIKNIVFTAHALAANDKTPLARSHLAVVMDLDEEFQKDYSGAGQIENNQSYT